MQISHVTTSLVGGQYTARARETAFAPGTEALLAVGSARMRRSHDHRRDFARGRTAGLFRAIENIFYIGVALVLAGAGVALFGGALYTFLSNLAGGTFQNNILVLLDGMLLVFIVTELIHTISAVLRENVLLTEPFLIVGIVAAIRRLIVISAEAKSLLGTPQFQDAMVEMAVLTAVVVALAAAIWLLRHTDHSEPRPAYEPEQGEES
jgi:uncharacterized membrane protein (DUF373 family)